MNDYKELVENMRNNGDCITADIIEQLVKERDAAVADLKNNRVCTVCVFGNDDTLFPCEDCCAYTDNYFEWRGGDNT